MKTQPITVIDGPLPPNLWQRPGMEPQLVTAPELISILKELMQREPIFHRADSDTSRAAFEKLTAPEFWEVGASGRRYSRKFVLDTLEERYAHPTQTVWEIGEPHCLQIAPDNYLLTYTLIQKGRATRRATIWRRTADGWQILYHQGTVVAP